MADIDKRHVDRRTVDRYKEKGLLKEADYQSYLKGLPDDAANAQWVQMDLHDTEISEEEMMSEGEEEGA